MPLRVEPEGLRALSRLLSPDEEARARRLRTAEAHGRFVAARGFLRMLLAGYLDLPPEALRFTYGPHGKPAVAAGQNPAGVTFNLSHSGDLALLAVGRGAEVGVDVERVREGFPWRRVAERWFTAAECAWLGRLSEEEGREAFFSLWVRREAAAKARGGSVLGVRVHSMEGAACRFMPATGFIAAVVVDERHG